VKIELRSVKVSELVAGYVDHQEEGVRGYGGKLNIRLGPFDSVSTESPFESADGASAAGSSTAPLAVLRLTYRTG